MIKSKNSIMAQPLDRELIGELDELAVWVGWKAERKEGRKGLMKVPYDVESNTRVSCNVKNGWYELKAVEAAREHGRYDGIGMMLIEGLVLIDIDDCVNEAREIDPRAQELIDLGSSYSEISVSGKGIHIVGEGYLSPGSGCRINYKEMPIEVYGEKRFSTMSGDVVSRKPFANIQSLIDLIFKDHKIKVEPTQNGLKATCDPPFPDPTDVSSDPDWLLGKMLTSKNGKEIRSLMAGKISAYGSDPSRADMALCSYLAWWTNKRPELMDAIFRRSKLYRDKWDERHGDQTYGGLTIAAACAGCEGGYEHKSGGGNSDKDPYETFKSNLKRIRERSAMVQVGNKIYFISENADRSAHQLMERKDLIEKHEQDIVTVLRDKDRPKELNPIKKWLRDPDKRQYHELVFRPAGCKSEQYNLFKGWGVEPSEQGSCDLFLAHLRENICDDDSEAYEFLLDWIADIFQNPQIKHNTAVVLQGEQGTGKSIFAETIGHLVGRQHFTVIASIGELVGRFNKQYATSMLIFADEALAPRDLERRGKLKHLISSTTLTIEEKGKDSYPVDNYTRFIFASNNDTVIPAENNERRYFVLRVKNTRRNDTAYFGAMAAQLNNGGYAALMKFMLAREIKSNLRVCPKTQYLRAQMINMQDPTQAWILQRLQAHSLNGKAWLDDFYQVYRDEIRSAGESARDKSWFSRDFKKYFPHRKQIRTIRENKPNHDRTAKDARVQMIDLGTHEECVASFERVTGITVIDTTEFYINPDEDAADENETEIDDPVERQGYSYGPDPE